VSVNTAAGIDVAIYTESGALPQNIADQETAMLKDAIQGTVNLTLFTPNEQDALADWVQAHTSGENHILILSGLLPTSIYAPGNTEPDGSIVEEFLDAGNTIIYVSEYSFYAIEGKQEANETGALQAILDVPEAYVWPTRGSKWSADKPRMTPTEDGKKYTPSIVEYDGKYPIHLEDYDGTDWEVEIALAENTDDPDDTRYDPCVIINTETGGRFGVFFQNFDRAGAVDLPRAEVISEYILNYYLAEVAAVEVDGKMISTWSRIKGEY
jgi:hypothetical protein